MADETIGSVSVQITGDYSGLEKSFSESQSLAQSAGQQIGSALESGADGANALTTAIFGTADAMTGVIKPTEDAEARLQELLKTGMTAAEALAALQAETAKTAIAEDQLAPASAQAAAGVAAVGQAAAGSTPPLNQAAQASDALTDSLVSLAASLLTIQAFNQLGEDSLMAYGRVQQLTTSLDLMGAGAVGAAQKVEELKTLAVQLAVPFDELSSQARKLSAVFGTGMNMDAVLIAAGDDAAATGRSFDTVANALERIEATGTLTGRQLVTLGISWEQMAESMGVSVEEAQQRMKQGAQSASQDVADTIAAIESKFGGAAERQAENVLGVWTNVKNQTTFIFQIIGEQMGAIGPIISDALKLAASGVIAFIGGIQLATVAVVGMVREGAEGLKGLGAVAIASMKGDFIGAAVAASDAYTKIKTAGEYTDQSLQDHAKKTAESLIAVWSDSGKKISATFTPTGGGSGGNDGGLQATKDKIKGFSDQASSLQLLIDMEKMEIAQQRAVTTETAKFNEATGALVSQEDYLAIKTALAGEALKAFYKSADIGPAPKEAFDALSKSIDQSDKLIAKIGQDIAATKQQALDTDPWAQLERALESVGLHGADYFQKLADTANKAYDDALDSGKATYQQLAELALISAEAQIRAELEVGSITREEADKTIAQIEADLKKLDIEHAGSVTNRGNRERTLGDDIQAINKKTFSSLERGLADSIVNLKGFDDLWKTLWQGLAKDLLNIMFKVLLDPLEKAIGKVLGGVFGGAGGAVGSAAGGAASAGGSVASSAGGVASAASGGLTGILTSVFTGLTAASSIFGNFQQAQSETTLNAIEESTRYLKIGLVTQGDSLLNDSHVIRNALTDFMKWNQNVFQTYLQNINIDLDKLTNMGGIHSSATQSQVSTFSTEKAVVADQSSNVIVNIDTVSSDVTDTKVRDVFNRGIRMSKLAGAFPAGRFPQ